jgi:ribosomal RNA-processing protein 8
MFSVPGWSVSAANLKTEGGKDSKSSDKPTEKTGSNKRKRPSGPSTVNPGNVADLWESVIEGKSGKKAKLDSGSASESKKQGKREKKRDAAKQEDVHVADEVAAGADTTAERPAQAGTASKESTKEEKSKKKKQKKFKGDQPQPADSQPAPVETKKDAGKTASAVAPAAPPKLTPLQASMREKLISARFRHLNETLYTRPSAEAFELFDESPEMFQEYHEGFRRQVNVWPENPVDGYIRDIKLRGRQRQPHKDKGKPGQGGHAAKGPAPLLRTNGTRRSSPRRRSSTSTSSPMTCRVPAR